MKITAYCGIIGMLTYTGLVIGFTFLNYNLVEAISTSAIFAIFIMMLASKE